MVNRTKPPLISVLRVFLIFLQPRYRSWPRIYASIFRDQRRVVREGRCRRGRRIVRAAWRVPIPLFSAPRQAADNINVGREGAGADAWKRRPAPGVDICASELIPPPCACMGARGCANTCACICVRARETKERRRDEGESGWRREGGGGGMTGVSSRAGEITHFDGIKMSVFPTPICGEIARNRARCEGEKAGERERGKFSLFSRGPPSRRGEGEVTFLREEKEERKCLALDRALFSTSSRTTILWCISERSRGCLSTWVLFRVDPSWAIVLGIYGNTKGDCVALLHFNTRGVFFILLVI